jgi:hypothetical protein
MSHAEIIRTAVGEYLANMDGQRHQNKGNKLTDTVDRDLFAPVLGRDFAPEDMTIHLTDDDGKVVETWGFGRLTTEAIDRICNSAGWDPKVIDNRWKAFVIIKVASDEQAEAEPELREPLSHDEVVESVRELAHLGHLKIK